MRLMWMLMALFAVLGLSGATQAQDGAMQAEAYQVQLAITNDGKLIGTPRITLLAGRPGSIELSGVYRVDLAVNTTSDANYPIGVTTALFLPRGDRLTEVARPSFRVKLDEQASMELGNATSQPLRMAVIVSRASDATAAAHSPTCNGPALTRLGPSCSEPPRCRAITAAAQCNRVTLTCCGGCCFEGTCGAGCCPP